MSPILWQSDIKDCSVATSKGAHFLPTTSWNVDLVSMYVCMHLPVPGDLATVHKSSKYTHEVLCFCVLSVCMCIL